MGPLPVVGTNALNLSHWTSCLYPGTNTRDRSVQTRRRGRARWLMPLKIYVQVRLTRKVRSWEWRQDVQGEEGRPRRRRMSEESGAGPGRKRSRESLGPGVLKDSQGRGPGGSREAEAASSREQTKNGPGGSRRSSTGSVSDKD